MPPEAPEKITNEHRCEVHNFGYENGAACPCCYAEAIKPKVFFTGVSSAHEKIDVPLPLVPGAIIDDDTRHVIYQGLRAEINLLIRKWGFTDYNVQLKWPDTDNHPIIEFFSARFKSYKHFLGSMIDKCGTLRPSSKLRFIQALVRALDQLGYFQELQTIMTGYIFQRENNNGGIRPEENDDDDEQGD